MKTRRHRLLRLAAAASGAALWLTCAMWGCGSEGGTGSGGHTLEAGTVRGRVLAHEGLPTVDGQASPIVPGGAREGGVIHPLASATWRVEETSRNGETAGDGTFTISELSPGTHWVAVQKTVNGNLLSVRFPVTVVDGSDTLVGVEMRWGEAKVTSRYRDERGEWVSVMFTSGPHAYFRDGELVEYLTAEGLVLSDTNGDGKIDTCEPGDEALPPHPCSTGDLVAIEIVGWAAPGEAPSLVVGQTGHLAAVGIYEDGSRLSLDLLATWRSTAAEVAEVNDWGEVKALSAGETEITASFADTTSAPLSIEVTPRPALQEITVENLSCSVLTAGAEEAGVGTPSGVSSSPWYLPQCTNSVLTGDSLLFRASGSFDGGYSEDITDEVAWRLVPEAVGRIDQTGLFTGVAAGNTLLTAELEGKTSDPLEIRVVDKATISSIEIYAERSPQPLPLRESDAPCCPQPLPQKITVLAGDEVPFHAIAHYDTGYWEEITENVTWVSTEPGVGTIDVHGLFQALGGGTTVITAARDGVTSAPCTAEIVAEATVVSLYAYAEQPERIVKKGGNAFFHAFADYDVGISREVTESATWRVSDSRVGRIEAGGIFTALDAGKVQVWAELSGVESNREELEVWQESDLNYCDMEHFNRGIWSDAFNRVILETDCGEYTQGSLVTIRYTVEEIQPNPAPLIDPCLDLYVLRGEEKLRTIREEGCGEAFALPAEAARLAPVYQLLAFWDLKDSAGNQVPPGIYTIYGRFYLYYDPVVSVEVRVR